MKLKLNKPLENPVNSDANKIYSETRSKLLSNMVQDLEDNSIDLEDVEINNESIERSNKKYKELFIKKTILYVAIIMLFLSVVIFGTYKTFFEHKYTGQEIAELSNYYNIKTNFPESGVQGYLNLNINTLLKEKLNIGTTVNTMSIGTPAITKINTKNDTFANIYFYVNLISNVGNVKINAVLPINWDKVNEQYTPAGDIIFTPNKPTNIETTSVKNNFLSFDNIAKEEAISTDTSKVFIDNFFTILYSGQDISPYYDGATKLDASGIKYGGMTNYTLYKGANTNGYNTFCSITLIMPNGISYTTEKYLSISKSGKSWIIKAVL